MESKEMRDIIDWLIRIERMAKELYGDAAEYFKEDENFASFLKILSNDEEYHRQIMESASSHLEGSLMNGHAAIALDADIKLKVERPLAESRQMLDEGNISGELMMERIITAEFSEWNDIFLYVVNSFINTGREFQHAASQMQRHKNSIEHRCYEQPGCAADIEKIRNLNPLWKNRILVVDDSDAIVRFLKAVCEKEGVVDTAFNGRDALKKAGENYYDLVISDIEMPVMDGIRFFREAERLDPGIGERFLFFSGLPEDENISFLREHKIKFLSKPAPISDIQNAIRKILH